MKTKNLPEDTKKAGRSARLQEEANDHRMPGADIFAIGQVVANLLHQVRGDVGLDGRLPIAPVIGRAKAAIASRR